jgi:hypothetical protein
MMTQSPLTPEARERLAALLLAALRAHRPPPPRPAP